ncbi:unnamed protein product [Tilletia controversa]|uniref:Uncharacterized protein n=1 Tax=Tilletia controversa TaxID=13291 RepID=A0A8X7MXD4_9BASI|nr:hypothetical protein CF328_g1953 [Tilletia controversa]KAE8251903.1 hypothetical protein A4X06_0g2485 [Tilletia controversa]CAD6902884.1 unnamed protein product [Tilletia controversa]CAD6920346.1 unnamed protein product [Tilletia controversa]CAD6951442.1 unnamed protein product [Tilletia controversa]
MSGNSNPGNGDGSFAKQPQEGYVQSVRQGDQTSGQGHNRTESRDTDPGHTEDSSYGSDGIKGTRGFAYVPTNKIKQIASMGGGSSGNTGTAISNDADDEGFYDGQVA